MQGQVEKQKKSWQENYEDAWRILFEFSGLTDRHIKLIIDQDDSEEADVGRAAVIITEIERKRGRVSVVLNDDEAIEISAKLAKERDLRPGVAMTEVEVAELASELGQEQPLAATEIDHAIGPQAAQVVEKRGHPVAGSRHLAPVVVAPLRELLIVGAIDACGVSHAQSIQRL